VLILITSTVRKLVCVKNMDIVKLRLLLKLKRLTQASFAKKIGVSRQAVSKWFQSKTFIPMNTKHLQKISHVFGVNVNELMQSLPFFQNHTLIEQMRSEFLWDYLYPTFEDFILALTRFHYPAVARLVECRGLFYTYRILGNKVWKEFTSYKLNIHPIRRQECERLWTLQQNLGLI